LKNPIDQDSGVQSGYRQMLKATSLFGGVQVINILITIFRGKIVSLLLGPAGMGVNGIYLTAVTLVRNLTSFGIPESAVKDIAAASATRDEFRISKVLTVFSRWIWFTAFLGTILTLAFSKFLSRYAFGNEEHTGSFMLLSLVPLLTALTGSTYSLLRGLRHHRHLASANIAGGIFGLLAALPFLYIYHEDGIAVAILASATAAFIVSLFFRNQIHFSKVPMTIRETVENGVDMAKLGIVFSLTTFLTPALTFVLNGFMIKNGSLFDVGIYNAGVTITSGYVGIVFTGMITDYFPRLASVITNEAEWKKVVQQQAELVLLVLAPLLLFLLAIAPLLINLLLTNEFLPVLEYMNWAILGIFLQGIVWSLGVIIMAKGDIHVKLYAEVSGQLFLLLVNIVGYIYLGLKGLGIALLISQIFNLILALAIARYRYNFMFNWPFVRLSVTLGLCCLIVFASATYLGYPSTYIVGGVTFMMAGIFCFYQLHLRVDFFEIVKSVKKRFTK
jgi:O-antigen/teichoic acid export membrane protein